LVIIVHTYNPEEEIWHHIEKLTNKGYVKKLLNFRVDNKFFTNSSNNEFAIDFGKINKSKMNYRNVENYKPLSENYNLDKSISDIVIFTRQAIEMFKASQVVSFTSKPILLYYSYMILGRVLFLSTYERDYNKLKGSNTHGLEFIIDDGKIKCSKVGSFARFHDSYSSSPEIYLEEKRFRWLDLLYLPTNKFEIKHDIQKDGNIVVKNHHSIKAESGLKKVSVFQIDEMTREMLFLYYASNLARYKPVYWSKMLERAEYGWRITDYLRSMQSLFPNIIFNYLHGDRCEFYPEVRPAGYFDDYVPPF